MIGVDEIARRAGEMGGALVAIEAYWDGDTQGWFVTMEAIVAGGGPQHPRFRSIYLADLRDGGDIRLFNGQVPPWPEAVRAIAIGEDLARAFDVPFHFASRDQPRDECVRWWARGEGRPCDDCGIEIVRDAEVPWAGLCYPCHLAREARLPRVRVEPLADLGRDEQEQIHARVRAALGANYVRSALSVVPGQQWHSFTVTDADAATAAVIAALRATGALARVRVLVASSAHDPAVPVA